MEIEVFKKCMCTQRETERERENRRKVENVYVPSKH